MRPRKILVGLVAVFWIGCALAGSTEAGGRIPSGEAHWLFSGWGGDADRTWDPGFGFALAGNLPLGRALDLRADWGARWLDGDERAVGPIGRGPRWGGPPAMHPSGLRVMPLTLSLVYRFESWSHGRFWVPYAGAGPGLYDLRAGFRQHPAGPDANAVSAVTEERHHNLFRFGWHARAGARFHRTSGLFLDLGAAAHYVDLPGAWSPLWEASLGVGAFFHGSSR